MPVVSAAGGAVNVVRAEGARAREATTELDIEELVGSDGTGQV